MAVKCNNNYQLLKCDIYRILNIVLFLSEMKSPEFITLGSSTYRQHD